MFRTKLSRIAALTLVAVLGVSIAATACGGDDDDDDADGANPTASLPQGASTATSGSSTPGGDATAPASATAPAGDDEFTISTADSTLGTIIVDADGLTLYTFNNDTAGSGTSACEAGCDAVWPAATVTGTPTGSADITGEIGTITRTDGAVQVTYKGLPLYRFVNDAAPGDTKGEGVGGVWFVAKP